MVLPTFSSNHQGFRRLYLRRGGQPYVEKWAFLGRPCRCGVPDYVGNSKKSVSENRVSRWPRHGSGIRACNFGSRGSRRRFSIAPPTRRKPGSTAPEVVFHIRAGLRFHIAFLASTRSTRRKGPTAISITAALPILRQIGASATSVAERSVIWNRQIVSSTLRV